MGSRKEVNKSMARSNYEIMRDQMRLEFVKYDQENMIEIRKK